MLAIIQVAVGLIFVYSLLSILATTINSVVSNILKWRSEYLKKGLISLLTDAEIQAQFLAHPLIGLVKTPMVTPEDTYHPANAQVVAQEVQQAEVTTVSWIDPKTFAQVIVSLLAEKADVSLYGPLLIAINNLPESQTKLDLLDLTFALQSAGVGMSEIRTTIATLPANLQAPLLDALKPIEAHRLDTQLNDAESSRLLPVLDGLRRINDDAFRRALKVLVAGAETLDEAQKNLEMWFNQRMDQVTELYKRRLVIVSLLIGVVLAILLNADTLQMARALWEDPALRATIVSAANGAVASGQLQDTINSLATATPLPTLIPGATAIPNAEVLPQAATPTPTQESPTNDELARQFQDTLNQLLNLNLPIGWEYTPIDGGCFVEQNRPLQCDSMRNLWLIIPGNSPDWFGLILRKVIGMAATVIAVAQGAPFWFDLLRRLVKG